MELSIGRTDDGPVVLSVRDLRVTFATPDGGELHAVNGVSFDVRAGETVGIVGESGCGKSTTGLALMGLLPPNTAGRPSGNVYCGDVDLLALGEEDLRRARGRDIAMIFQDPMTSLNPAMTIGEQLTETLRAHDPLAKPAARARATELLDAVGISDPSRRAGQYPHQLSGGMRQRVMIAIALALEPKVLIADEPTTALDVTIEAQVLDLLQRLVAESGTALVMITHDLGVIAGMTRDVHVMYAGSIVESTPTDRLFGAPSHPYSVGLLRSVPRIDAEWRSELHPVPGSPPTLRTVPVGCPFAPRCDWRLARCLRDRPVLRPHQDGEAERFDQQHQIACHNPPTPDEAEAGHPLSETTDAPPEPSRPSTILLSRRADLCADAPSGDVSNGEPDGHRSALVAATNLRVWFGDERKRLGRTQSAAVKAVNDVTIQIKRGETLGLVGESGSGKSTLARAIVGLDQVSDGIVELDGQDIEARRGQARRRVQMIFQDPYSTLDPRMTIGASLTEPMAIHSIVPKAARRDAVTELLQLVGLGPDYAGRYPRALSGGQRQRVSIARALAANPDLIIADEPISSLDVSIQAQIINLMKRLQDELQLSYLFITHDIAAVRILSHRVAVMYLGRIVEAGPSLDVTTDPAHPYTVALMSAVPRPDPGLERMRKRVLLEGDVPSPMALPSGCSFHTRCWLRAQIPDTDRCVSEVPLLREVAPGRQIACHFAEVNAARNRPSMLASPTEANPQVPVVNAVSQPSESH